MSRGRPSRRPRTGTRPAGAGRGRSTVAARPAVVGRGLTAVGTGLAVASLALTVDNLRRLRTPPATPPPLTDRVTVLLPARDEAATIGRCLAALRAALDAVELGPGGDVGVLVLDDDSADTTAELVAAVADDDPRVRLLAGKPVPEGWLAKPWACHQLAAAAPPDTTVLLFVDADVEVAPSAIAASVAMLRGRGRGEDGGDLDLLSPWPRQIAVGPAERLVQPLLFWSWCSTLPLHPAEHSPRPSLAAANGQLLVLDADAYRRAGGHDAVRGEVLDDLGLLRAVKRSGGRGVVADGTDLAACRMYSGAGALRDGHGKSLWAAFGSPGGVALLAVLGLAHVVPPVAALGGSRVGLAGYGASVASRWLVARRTRAPRVDALAHPASLLTLGGLVVDSVVRHRRGTLRWRGRPVQVDPRR